MGSSPKALLTIWRFFKVTWSLRNSVTAILGAAVDSFFFKMVMASRTDGFNWKVSLLNIILIYLLLYTLYFYSILFCEIDINFHTKKINGVVLFPRHLYKAQKKPWIEKPRASLAITTPKAADHRCYACTNLGDMKHMRPRKILWRSLSHQSELVTWLLV